MDACTITALDVITAFAVPNPNGSSQSPSVFSGLVALQVALPNGSPQNVNAPFRCKLHKKMSRSRLCILLSNLELQSCICDVPAFPQLLPQLGKPGDSGKRTTEYILTRADK